jgi:hypothetical protein
MHTLSKKPTGTLPIEFRPCFGALSDADWDQYWDQSRKMPRSIRPNGAFFNLKHWRRRADSNR